VPMQYERGEVWIIDFGFVAKTRPALILSVPDEDADRALITCVPHSTSLRGSKYEIATAARFLKQGAFVAQNLLTVPRAKLVRRLGKLDAEDLAQVESAVRMWIGFE
jgi:mRNA interferase MazF